METVHPKKIVSFLIHLFITEKKPLTFAFVSKKVWNDLGIETSTSYLLDYIGRLPDNFEVYNDNGQTYVKVITNLSLCELHCSSKTSCTGGSECTGLHICKFYLLKGSCRFGGSCKFGHDLTTPHNGRLVRENHLSGLGVEDIRYLLNLPENRTKTTIPEVCKFYNLAVGCRQASTGNCPFLHVCRYYLQGSCQFGKKCSRSHDIDENVKKILKKHGIDTDKPVKELLDDLRVLYKSENEDDDDDKLDGQAAGPARCSSQPVLSKASSMKSLSLAQEKCNPRGKLAPAPSSKKLTRAGSTADLANTGVIVCLYHLRGKCAFGKNCRNFHGTLPYQWQYRMGKEDPWEDVEHRGNQELELTYSQPKDSEAYLSLSNGQIMQIIFSTMTGLVKGVGTFEVRCLSTVSSGEAKSEPLATDWIWYWIDDAKEWIQYGAGSNLRKRAYASAVTSDDIEKVYLANPDGAMRFNTEGHEYLLDFNKMAQINTKIGTERPVRRRPVFVQDLVKMKGRLKGSSSEEKSATSGDVRVPVPPDWEVQGGRDITDHFKLTKITKRTNIREYSKVEQLFFETMPNTATITSIERVENGELWMYYCFKKERMQKKSDGKVDERQLFHGTNPEYVDAICQQNFDFRLSGLSYGTRYGKGSYFAVEAKYSDSYTDHSNRVMFLVKVLVGQYKKGQSKFVRPPSKDESNKASDLYDACVDDENNPTIFVIFDRCQMYPEFLIKYEIKAPKLF